MRIDIVFDTVCPWCFIGKHRLEQALALRPGVKAELRWRPFLLNPDLPPEGMDRDSYLERKFGSSYRIQRIQGAAQQAGESEGITFAFERMTRTPNSVQSHRLIQWAGAYGALQTDLVEAVFRAYFEEGRDISELAVLVLLAEQVGLPAREALDHLQSSDGWAEIEDQNARMHRLGVTGVPCYILDDRYAVSGAQEPDMLARLIDIARETEPERVSTR
jgi:predicted DsbA family dithiol-disulfide isomerase